MEHVWGWQFWHTVSHLAGRCACTCGWRTNAMKVHLVQAGDTLAGMAELEGFAVQHTHMRGWDVLYPSRLEVPV